MITLAHSADFRGVAPSVQIGHVIEAHALISIWSNTPFVSVTLPVVSVSGDPSVRNGRVAVCRERFLTGLERAIGRLPVVNDLLGRMPVGHQQCRQAIVNVSLGQSVQTLEAPQCRRKRCKNSTNDIDSQPFVEVQSLIFTL